MYLSIGAAVSTIALKFAAYFLTGSVGLLSDAMESLVNLAGASAALVALIIAARPADRTHPYGHTKAEYFSSGLEGGLILVAAIAIGWTALQRLLQPAPIESAGFGLGISLVATLINFLVARVLLKVGQEMDSIALEADGKHLMTDVFTSLGVGAGVILVALTGWLWLDPLIALAVAANIIFEGSKLVGRSIDGLLDHALPDEEEILIKNLIETELAQIGEKALTYHGLRTRKSGGNRFIELHLLTPGEWSVRQAHDISEQVETKLKQRFREAEVTTHIEPIDDPRSYGDNWEDPKN